ncbi:MAG: hypothetical protein EOO77_10540 [Oxalobacteraceae bacterium]|nr:MAG: hypothetical protein EOO77_10540 [Oxalobacteraceae bacterium]
MNMITASDQAFFDRMDVSLRPGAVEELAAFIVIEFDRLGYGVLPRLSHVTQEQIDSDWCSLTFHVYISTDLLLPIELFGPPRQISAMRVVDIIRDLWPHREVIITAAEISRCALERYLHDVGAVRADMNLCSVALGPADSWADAETPTLEPDIDTIGDDLKRRRHRTHFSTVEASGYLYRDLVRSHIRRAELKRFLTDRDATGSMDQLTWAALKALPDPEHVLRQLGRHERVWPTNELFMGWQDGRVVSSGEKFQGLSWNGSYLELPGVCLPATSLLAAAGRSVTLICDHPLLSEAMIVSGAWQAPVDDSAYEPVLVIELDVADHLFSCVPARVDANPLNFRSKTHLYGSNEAVWAAAQLS